VLTQRIAGHPFAVLLLDEFEKAHEKVADRFLQLFDEGAFINGHGETVACRSLILIATSNVGAELYREQPTGFLAPPDVARLAHDLDRRLTQRFRIELLNRFDQVVHFQPLSRADVRAIAARELQSLKHRIGFKRSGLELEVDEGVLDWLAAHGYDPRFGARFLRRTLEREVTSALAGLLVGGAIAPDAHALLTVRRNRIEARLVEPGAPLAPTRAVVTLPLAAATETRMLDRETLQRTAAALIASSKDLSSGLDRKRDEARRLLETMNAPGFWDAGPDARDTLDRYRSLDVAIQVEDRFARTLWNLEIQLQSGAATKDLKSLARQVEAAAGALREWNDRSIDEGPHDVWLLIERADALQPSEPWLSELAQMELAWCRRVRLEATVVACELLDREPSRIVIHVEGPGAGAWLAAEEGVHRRVRKTGSDLKARIEVVRRRRQAAAAAMRARVLTGRPRTGPLDLSITCSGRLEMPASGLTIELLGSDPDTLAEVLADLEAHREGGPRDRSSVARTYGKDGVGARDPRTGATQVRLKDALRGELGVFLDAWRAHRLATSSETRPPE
jgi:ATP-dependent Clp protease ATP-binding subunit ClpC